MMMERRIKRKHGQNNVDVDDVSNAETPSMGMDEM